MNPKNRKKLGKITKRTHIDHQPLPNHPFPIPIVRPKVVIMANLAREVVAQFPQTLQGMCEREGIMITLDEARALLKGSYVGN